MTDENVAATFFNASSKANVHGRQASSETLFSCVVSFCFIFFLKKRCSHTVSVYPFFIFFCFDRCLRGGGKGMTIKVPLCLWSQYANLCFVSFKLTIIKISL
jgi:hypothetical protein